ncbi:hypothetical protein CCP4SC76_5410028 [Gammaproteobacteria bacterium]
MVVFMTVNTFEVDHGPRLDTASPAVVVEPARVTPRAAHSGCDLQSVWRNCLPMRGCLKHES